MGLFGQIVGTIVETVKLPVAVIQDAASLGGAVSGQYEEKGKTYTGEQLDKIKEAASKEEDE